jgi:hypothetical protein
MEEQTPNNPAGRFLQIAERMIDAGRRGKNSREQWADLLGVRNDDYPNLMRRIGDVAGMEQAVSAAAQKLDAIDPRHLIGWFPKFFRPWQDFNFSGGFEHFSNPVDETVIALLNITNDLLSRHRPEPTVAEEQLAAIERDIADVAAEINASDLEEFLQRLLTAIH